MRYAWPLCMSQKISFSRSAQACAGSIEMTTDSFLPLFVIKNATLLRLQYKKGKLVNYFACRECNVNYSMPEQKTLTDNEIIQLVNNEFTYNSLTVTAQYLEIHQPVYENGTIKIDRIDRDKNDGIIIVYLPVANEHFFFAVYIDSDSKEVINVGTEPRNTVELVATSERLLCADFSFLTTIKPSRSQNKGDVNSNGKSICQYSFIGYEPNPEPDEFEDKLKKLLLLLVKEKEAVKKLTSTANAYIQIIVDFHAGNQLLGGIDIDLDALDQLSKLGLPIRFEFTSWGKAFR